MAGLKELKEVAAHATGALPVKEALAGPLLDRSRGIKRRKGPGYGLPCADNLDAMRSVWEGFEAAAAQVQSRLAERESAVTVREVACCSVEARLAQRSAQLEEWEARLRERAAALEQVRSSLQELQERGRVKGVALHEDTDSDLDAADVPAGAVFWPASQPQQQPQQQQQPVAWQPEPQFKGFWADSAHYGNMTPEQPESPVLPAQHSSTPTKLHFAALEGGDSQGRPRVGVRLVCSTPTPTNSANSIDSQSHGSADTAAAGHAAVHSRLQQAAAAAAAASPSQPIDGHVEVRTNSVNSVLKSALLQQPPQLQRQGEERVGVPCKLGMKLAKMEAAAPRQQHQQPTPVPSMPSIVPPLFQGMTSDGEQKLDSLAEAAEVVEGVSQRGRSPVRGLAQRMPDHNQAAASGEAGAVAGPFVKALDYKSCDHILCLTKDMARELFPPAPHSSAGGPSQAVVELEDDSGRAWQMTYRCVPHRYSYELRAGWKAFAHFWNVGVGDTVVLWRDPPPHSALRISVRAPALYAPVPAAATRHGAGRASY